MSKAKAVKPAAPPPRHVAIVMDGNGRWAQRRFLPRTSGHKFGVDALRAAVRHAALRGIEHLTVFAFSSENWRRPPDEVRTLMELFVQALKRESADLARQGVQLHIVGDVSALSDDMRALIAETEAATRDNSRLVLNVALNYGGRWDMVQAAQSLQRDGVPIDEAGLASRLALAHSPDPDLLIRTGGERRISNFLLWQLAYAELYFTPVLWPDFDAEALDRALAWYAGRERRFGQTSAQLQESARA